jgi:hypothetical protein
MSLGAHNLASVLNEGEIEGLTFRARILPFRKDGTRSEKPRIMQVIITHNALDYYDARVIYTSAREILTHYETSNIDAEQLPRIMLALDYDGATALNPQVL